MTGDARVFDQLIVGLQRGREDRRELVRRNRALHPARHPAVTDGGPDGFHARPSPRFVRSQHLVDVGGAAEQLGQGDGVFDRHGRPLREQRRERVRRVTHQEHPAPVVRRRHDFLNWNEDDTGRVVLLLDQGRDIAAESGGQFLEARQPLGARQHRDAGAGGQQEGVNLARRDGEAAEEATGGGAEPEHRIALGAVHDRPPCAERPVHGPDVRIDDLAYGRADPVRSHHQIEPGAGPV